ncbi:HAMP domain-containing sensor histidine kinase [Rhodoferax sp.]|uniref:sensor histidine kinase n=1 Tax=Rhodoferax sp. TaxID=50421 RepID=UPI0025F2DB54|nr:HAMP domain-containing sensor histidine kinase [Rhodoferax sp.]
MTVRFKIALTILLTGLFTVLGVLVVVGLAFKQFEHESAYYRASAFLDRVIAKHNDMFAMQDRYQENFDGFLSNLVLFEPGTQIYLLDSQGTVKASSTEDTSTRGVRVALGPVQEAAGAKPMPYVMGDNPESGSAATIVAARALYRNSIGQHAAPDGYLYVVCDKPLLTPSNWMALQSTFALPTVVLIFLVVGLGTLMAVWVISHVTRPLARITTALAHVTQHGLPIMPPGAAQEGQPNAPPPLPDDLWGTAATSKDELGQLHNGIRAMLLALRAQWSLLARLDHFRREAVSNLSHDLRSPLTATAACLETLETRWAQQAQHSADLPLVQTALRNTRNAARLVQSMGDLAHLDEPAFQLKPQVMDLGELLDDIALRFGPRAQQQGMALVVLPTDPADPPCAAVDVELIERALSNLLDNALKFCRSGDTITLAAQRQGAEWVALQVRDTGPGIAQADLPQLFERYYQNKANVAPATGEGGKGLGLAIVKRIAELHTGRAEVHSSQPGGTTVSLVLPFCSDPHAVGALS